MFSDLRSRSSRSRFTFSSVLMNSNYLNATEGYLENVTCSCLKFVRDMYLSSDNLPYASNVTHIRLCAHVTDFVRTCCTISN